MEQISGFFRSKLILLSIGLIACIFSMGFIVINSLDNKYKEPELLAIIKIIDVDGKLYLETQYNSSRFKETCEAFRVVTETYIESCGTIKSDTIPKIKKL